MQMLARMIKPPPPVPCMTRPASSILMSLLTAAMRDPTKNSALAVNRMGLRPQMSLNFPHVGVAAAAANRYADPTHV